MKIVSIFHVPYISCINFIHSYCDVFVFLFSSAEKGTLRKSLTSSRVTCSYIEFFSPINSVILAPLSQSHAFNMHHMIAIDSGRYPKRADKRSIDLARINKDDQKDGENGKMFAIISPLLAIDTVTIFLPVQSIQFHQPRNQIHQSLLPTL